MDFLENSLMRLALAPLVLAATPAMAQDVAPAVPVTEDEEALRGADGSEILVVAHRLRGQLDVPQAPIETLDEADIAAYGASSITDLLAALSPQTGSGRGRGGGHPVILVNGQRISGFREMRNVPPEAIRRLEILPEEVALRFGYAANQRVINFILKENFVGKNASVEYNVPTRGGFSESEAEASMLRISGPNRFNLAVEISDTSPLFEAERGVIQPPGSLPTVAGDPDPGVARALVADSRQIVLNGTWTRGLGDRGMGGQISLNAAYTRSDSRSFSGLDTFTLIAPGGDSAVRALSDPLQRKTGSDKFESSLTLGKPLGRWNLTATADGGITHTRTLIDGRAGTAVLVNAAAAGTLPITGPLPALTPAGADSARSRNESATVLATLAGPLLRLPAGDAMATFKTGFAHTGITSNDTRTLTGETRLKRGDLSGGANLSLPLFSRRENVVGTLGEVTLNLSAGVNRLSDFGTLADWSAGLTWGLTEQLNLQASYLVKEAAPSLGDLGNPLISSFNVPVYDFQRGETALVTITSGGNRALVREKQCDLKFSASWQAPLISNATLMAEYFRNRSDNLTAGFPLLTPAIEAAFPGRVTRDASGRLIAIDRRAVTFARQEAERLRYGINLSGTIGKAPPGRGGAGMGGGGRMGGGRMGGAPGGRMGGGPPPGAMMGMMGGPGGGQGRWNLSLYHTIRFSDEVLIAPGGPRLDLLSGDALSGGGVARHALEFEGGLFHKGKGLRLNGSWTAPTNLRGSGLPGTSDLRFGSLFKVDLRAFLDMGQVSKSPLLKGMRIALTADNVFDSRQKVTDGSGTVPLSYQPDYMDPRGRVVGIDIRKVF